MADAAGSETATGAMSIKTENDTVPTTATGAMSIKTENDTVPTTGPCASGIKKEKDADPTQAGHLHRFTVKFSPDTKEYTIACVQPGTVLQAIKTCNKYHEEFQNENLLIQLGKKDKKYAIATHFPCTCIREGECLILSYGKEKIEETQGQNEEPIQSREMYSVFYIDREGGLNTKSKKFFRSTDFNRFKYLCVYGEKGKKRTVEDALRRDGRFIDDLGYFTLSHNTDPNKITECTQPVDNLHGKEFKLCLKRNENADREEVKQRIKVIQNTMENNPLSVKGLVDRVGAEKISEGNSGQSGSSFKVEEIYDLLRKQYPDLKEEMMRRFPGDSYQEALNLRKEDFGKIQQLFSDVHRVRELIKLGESVCKVVVKGYCEGTGFVLFDNFILANKHLFKRRVEKGNKKLKDDIEVEVLFNFEEQHKHFHHFQLAHRNILCCDDELDYAILELQPVGQKYDPDTNKLTKVNVPPGLLERFGPMPENGEACLIGHPDGGVKKLDPTSIIEIGNREKAVEDQLEPYKGTIFTLYSLRNLIQNQGIESIYVGGNKAEKRTTDNTYMYHGSSGSPVFDAQCKVFGLHSSGFVYDFPKDTKSVIELAQPLLTIFKHFVSKLRENGKEGLLKRVEEVAKGNSDLDKILKQILNPDSDEPM